MSAQHTLRWVGAEAFIAQPILPAPAILRFDGDDFMERVLGLLEATPQRLPELVAKRETWVALGKPTPEPLSLAAPATSGAARALKRKTALLDFRRDAQPPMSPQPGHDATPRLKLFQPIHQRYYLAAAHLVCELPGLPPRIASIGDKSGFVLRRLMGETEYGFVKENGTPGCWTPIGNPHTELAANEEWLRVFPLNYAPPQGPRRALLAGLIPVARHDEYRFARQATPDEAKGKDGPGWGRADELKALAQMKIVAPWQALVERTVQSMLAAGEKPNGSVDVVKELRPALQTLNNQLAEASWRLLQDFREFLHAYLPEVEARLNSDAPASFDKAGKLLDALTDVAWPQDWPQRLPDTVAASLSGDVVTSERRLSPSLRAALDAIGPVNGSVSNNLDLSTRPFPNPKPPHTGTVPWPNFAFLLVLADSSDAVDRQQLRLPLNSLSLSINDSTQGTAGNAIDQWFGFLADAIDEAVAADQPGSATHHSGAATPQATSAARLAHDLEKSLAADPGPPRYVLRFVHQRCDCGPLHPLAISAPSEVFELAGFFDSDAPQRPIRITLPFDTTPGGLRKYGKNSAFILSDVLCGQMQRVRKLGFGDLVRSVLPWPFHKDLNVKEMGPCPDGVVCSLSIPIITIVAFVLLLVIAVLLDLIFHWLPFFISCFKVPGLKGKR